MIETGPWPDDRQRLLLLGALGDGDAALAAFAAWQGGVDWEGNLDGGSFRLLPLLHANLARLGSDDPLMPRLRGIYRHSWCQAQLHRRHGTVAVATLAAAGIPVLACKGLVLANVYYDSPALRPMSDIDVMVPADRAMAALDALNAAGWHEPPGSRAHWSARRDVMQLLNHGIGLMHDRYGEFDLHWRLSDECRATTTAGFWDRALAFDIDGTRLLRLDPTDMLFHVVLHGMRSNGLPPLRWVADAAMILRRDGAVIDWPRLLATARTARVGHRLQAALAYLRGQVGLAIPPGPLAVPVSASWVERTEDWARRAGVAARSPRRRRLMAMAAVLPRLVVGDDRHQLPTLALDWGRRQFGLR